MSNLARRFPIYSKFLYLYPAPYRQRYNEQILQTAADMLDNAPTNKHIRVWARIAMELPASIAHQQAAYLSDGLLHETPEYVRRNTTVSALLFAPFFVIVLINDASGHGLYHSWLWNFAVLMAWILVLPAIGFAISGLTFLSWLRSRIKRGDTLKHSLLDIRHNGAMLGLTLLGIFILGLVFFHDSVHCVTGNPVRELRNTSQTLHCIGER